MKALKTSEISSTARAPISARTLDHLIESYKEIIDALVKGLVASPTGIIILHGCVPTIGGSNYSLTAGAAYYNGEIYLVDAFPTAAAPVGEIPVWVIDTSYRSGDPVEFKDSSGATAGFRNFHEIRKLKWQFGASGSGILDYNSGSVKTIPTLTLLLARILEAEGDIIDHENRLDFAEADILDLDTAKANKTQPSRATIETLPTNFAYTDIPNSKLTYFKDTLGFVHISGIFDADHEEIPSSSVNDLFILPSGSRPISELHFPALIVDNTSFITTPNVVISTGGVVSIIYDHILNTGSARTSINLSFRAGS